MNESTARRAAKWWADHLRNGAPMNNGDKSDLGFTGMALAMMLQDTMRKGMTAEGIQRFEDELTARIMVTPERELWWALDVDYHPSEYLIDAGKAAGIDVSFGALPWKTGMTIQGERITVRLGYGAITQEIA